MRSKEAVCVVATPMLAGRHAGLPPPANNRAALPISHVAVRGASFPHCLVGLCPHWLSGVSTLRNAVYNTFSPANLTTPLPVPPPLHALVMRSQTEGCREILSLVPSRALLRLLIIASTLSSNIAQCEPVRKSRIENGDDARGAELPNPLQSRLPPPTARIS